MADRYGLAIKGGDWWLADEGLAPTRVTQEQVDWLAAQEDGWEAGACDVRFSDATGDLLVITADGRWIEVAEDGACDDVTERVMS